MGEIRLTPNAVRVLENRCLRHDSKGRPAETPAQMFERVARAVADAERLYPHGDAARAEEAFYRIMTALEFLPNSPTLMNAGTELGQLAACFVLPVNDSLDSIFAAVGQMAKIHQSGGGTGFSFDRLRGAGSIVSSTGGPASGPVSFMRVFDTTTEIVRQGGRRRGANMGILRVDHPDILDFINAKTDPAQFHNFNISVAVTDSFMDALERGASYDIIDPTDRRTVSRLRASEVFDAIVRSAWLCGDPGLVFIDEINRHNPTPQLGEIEATNPCGEQPLLAYEACNLGSLNVSALADADEKSFDWERLRRNVHTAVHFLDNVVDVSKYPMEEIERRTKGNRKIGLGIMGFAEALIKLGIPYDSPEALEFAEKLMSFVTREGELASERIGRERGVFPNFGGSVWERRSRPLRNAAVTTIAPTGTISIIAGVSSGIEPLFALEFERNVLDGEKLPEKNALCHEYLERLGLAREEILRRIAQRGSVRGMEEIPEEIQRLFPTALDITPSRHVRMQAAFQRHTHSGVSKTVNLPNDASEQDVREVFLTAYRLKCKGVTVFRYGCRETQVLEIAGADRRDDDARGAAARGENDSG